MAASADRICKMCFYGCKGGLRRTHCSPVERNQVVTKTAKQKRRIVSQRWRTDRGNVSKLQNFILINNIVTIADVAGVRGYTPSTSYTSAAVRHPTMKFGLPHHVNDAHDNGDLVAVSFLTIQNFTQCLLRNKSDVTDQFTNAFGAFFIGTSS